MHAGEDATLCSEPAECRQPGELLFGASACHAIVLPAGEPLHAALLAAGGNALLPQVLRFEVRLDLRLHMPCEML